MHGDTQTDYLKLILYTWPHMRFFRQHQATGTEAMIAIHCRDRAALAMPLELIIGTRTMVMDSHNEIKESNEFTHSFRLATGVEN